MKCIFYYQYKNYIDFQTKIFFKIKIILNLICVDLKYHHFLKIDSKRVFFIKSILAEIILK